MSGHKFQQDIFRLLTNLDAAVSVMDIATYEVLFLNNYMKNVFGDVTGKLCWKVFQINQEGPCNFCTNKYLINPDGTPREESYELESWNDIMNSWLKISDKAIYWHDSRIVKLKIAINISASKVMDEKINQAHQKLDEANTALRVLLRQKEISYRKIEDNIMSNIQSVLEPILHTMEENIKKDDKNTQQYVASIRENIQKITSISPQKQTMDFFQLSPREIQVANYIKLAKTTKEIARLMNISHHSVETYRANIREKFSLKNKKTNLRSYLNSL